MENQIEIKHDISLVAKLYIWARTTVFIVGLVSIGIIVRSSVYGLPACLKSVELMQLQQDVADLGMAMAEVQDVQVSLYQKSKTQVARK